MSGLPLDDVKKLASSIAQRGRANGVRSFLHTAKPCQKLLTPLARRPNNSVNTVPIPRTVALILL